LAAEISAYAREWLTEEFEDGRVTHDGMPKPLPDARMWELANAMVGCSVSDASAQIESRGLLSRTLPLGAPMPLDYQPARITLWFERGRVIEAAAAGRVFR
jgi:hypothetical protein